MRNFQSLLGLLALCLLAACPAKQEEVGQQGRVGARPSVTPTPQPDAVEATATNAEQASAEEGTSEAPPPDVLDAIPEEGGLAGKWFALFGNGFNGHHLYASTEGHTLDFGGDGYVTWAMRGVANAGLGMRTRYRLEGSDLIITYAVSEFSKNTALAAATPLGFGRDKEIGLASAGRDKEIGLLDENAAVQGKGEDVELRLTVTGDGRYLGLADEFGHLTVYGRDRNPGKGLTSGIGGDWSGHAAPNQTFNASFTQKGDLVTAILDGGKLSFVGHVVNGYIAGELTSGDTTRLAALLPEDSSTLNGVTAGRPEWEIQFHFDFVR